VTPEERAAAEAYEREQDELLRMQRRARAVARFVRPLSAVAFVCLVIEVVWLALKGA